jgi:hypothetical protein
MQSKNTPGKDVKDRTAPSRAQLPNALELFSPSWQALKLNWLIIIFGAFPPIFAALLLIAAVQILVHFAASSNNGLITVVNVFSIIAGVVTLVVALPVAGVLVYWVKLQSAKDVKVQYFDAIRRCLHYFWRVLALSIVRGLLIGLGLILLIVPGLIMWRRYLLAPYYLVDKDISIAEAMRRSAASSKKFPAAIWGMIAVYIVLTILGFIPFIGWIIGTILSIAYLCAGAVRYFQIKDLKN